MMLPTSGVAQQELPFTGHKGDKQGYIFLQKARDSTSYY